MPKKNENKMNNNAKLLSKNIFAAKKWHGIGVEGGHDEVTLPTSSGDGER